ncbi:hypothetical protein Hdeb2414_s0001g00009581 [Helianthus debilis subsp. tardiflorus]
MKLPNSSRILRIFHNCGFCPFSSSFFWFKETSLNNVFILPALWTSLH